MVAFTLVTMGQRIADYANELFAANAYRDYLEVHGLSVQLTEALAEFWHQRIRSELVFADGSNAAAEDADNVEAFFDLGYRGARYSFGYPACPDLTDQTKLVPMLRARTGSASSSPRSSSGTRSSRRPRWSRTTPRPATSPPGDAGEPGLRPSCSTWTARWSTPRSCGRSRWNGWPDGWADSMSGWGQGGHGRSGHPRLGPDADRRSAAWIAGHDDTVRPAPAHHRRGLRRGHAVAAGCGARCSARSGLPAWPTALVTATHRSLVEIALKTLGRDRFDVDGLRRRGGQTEAGSGAVPAGDGAARGRVRRRRSPSRTRPTAHGRPPAAGVPVLVVPSEVAVPPGPGLVFADSLLDVDLELLRVIHRTAMPVAG